MRILRIEKLTRITHIRLALPEGREVNVNRSPKVDERLSDLAFVINDAFHRARRQLQEEMREMRGRTRTHAAPGY